MREHRHTEPYQEALNQDYNHYHRHALHTQEDPGYISAGEIDYSTPETPQPKAWDEKIGAILFVCLGIGYLFPFSALTQPVDYWAYLFPDKAMDFDITAMFMYSNLVALFGLTFLGGDRLSFTFRIVGGFAGQVLVLAFIPSSYFFHFDEHTNYITIMAATGVIAIVTAFLDSSMIAMTSKFPPAFQQSLQVGIGVSTLIGSLYRDATKIAFPPNKTVLSSLLYFYCGSATVLVCLVLYFVLINLPIAKECLEEIDEDEEDEEVGASTAVSDEDNNTERTPLLSAPNANNDGTALERPGAQRGDETRRKAYLSRVSGSSSGSGGSSHSRRPVVAPSPSRSPGGRKKPPPMTLWQVMRHTFSSQMLVLLIFTTTLAAWPPLVSEIQSHQFPELNDNHWWPLILLTTVSVFDTIGRLTMHYRLGLNYKTLWIVGLIRMLLVPAIALCVMARVFTHDVWSVLFSAIIGFTNGHTGSLAIMMASERCHHRDRHHAGSISAFFLNSGLVLGSTIGLWLDKVVPRGP
eukprot:Clim_evm44s191 gene=Clim_evmTU44s191